MANIYENILSLEQTKRYLRLDDDFIDDDTDIELMIEGALEYISENTNHIFNVQSKTYYSGNLCVVTVFDTPINTTDFGDNIPLHYSNMTKFNVEGPITLSVGYSDQLEVPKALINAALQIIQTWYYGGEKNVNFALIPQNVVQVINTYRRFMLI